MMMMSPSKMQAALSPNQKLVAVLPPSSSSSSQTPSQQQRWTLPLYSVASRSLQATLTWNNPTSSSMNPAEATNNSSIWQRLIFLNDDHVAGLYQHRHIVVWNIPRGIVSYTVDILKKGKSTTSEDDGSSKMMVLDVVTPLVDDSTAATAPFVFYALIQKDSKLYVHEYQVETGRLQRKIKCGHADQQQQPSHNSNHSHHHSLVVVVSSLSSHKSDNEDDDDDTPRGRILLTTGRRQVKLIDLSNGEKLSKMKLAADISGTLTATTSNSATNKSTVVVMAIPTASGVVVTTLDMEKDNDDEKKKKKAELEQVAILPIMLEDSNDENHHQGALQMWLKPKTTTISNNPSTNFDLMLLLNQTDVYEYSSSNKTVTVLQPNCRLERDLSAKQDDQQHVILPMSSSASSSSATALWHQVLAVLYRRGQGILVKPIPLLLQNDDQDASTYREKITISWKDDTTEDTSSSKDVDMLETSAGKKRKQPQNVATTLGPGQAGHELATVSDRPAKKQAKKQDDDDAEQGEGEAGARTASSALTIAERLQQLAALAQEEDDEDDDDDDNNANKDANNESKQQQQTKFVPKQATTQSLTQLLQQACASNDDGLLELALSVRDVRVIEQSMTELAQKQQQQEAAVEGNAPAIKWMDVLLTRLITRLANKPQRAEALSMWIQCWLQQHQQFEASSSASSSSSWQSVQGLLQPLRNLLQERVQTFSLWLQLEGRLSMMKS